MVRILYPLPADPPPRVRLEGSRFHYLVHVLRITAGQEIEVFDGRGRSFRAQVESVDRGGAQLRLGSALPSAPPRQIALIQALPKTDKMEWILQKGTELGATAFAPVESARAVVRLGTPRMGRRLERWRKIVEEAARQCGRADLPKVMPVAPLLENVRLLLPKHRILVLDERETECALAQALSAIETAGRPIALAVGPEGGWERSEIESMEELGATPVSLGKNTLRSETAAIAALAITVHLDGWFG
jgi:16S rRNA (uracil1498-N3)-methyltransferase